jgi:type II secretory pathway pseudopilin PulG
LIELIVAMAILMMGIVAVAQLVPWAIDLDQRNRSNSLSLVMAQRELEQMVRQSLEVRTNATLSDYNFVDADGASIRLGALPSPSAGPSNAAPPAPTQSGCAVTAGFIDFSQPCSAAGYVKTIIIGGINYEVRWNVVTSYGNDQGTMRPVTKRVTVATRSSEARPLPPASLSVLVAP